MIRPARRADHALPRELGGVLRPDQALTDPAARAAYASDAGLERGAPSVVLLPESRTEVQAVARAAAAAGAPIVPWGAGTGLAGGAVAGPGAWLVSLARLRAMRIDEAARVAVVGPGVVTDELDAAAARRGLRYPPDPGSGRSSTIGGNVATNAGGPRCVRDGVTGRWVIGLEAVLADGRTLRLDRRHAPGPDLVGLLVGSEGTLALLTEITLRLDAGPRAAATALLGFPDVPAAARAAAAIVAAGLVPSALELMDRRIVQAVEAWRPCGLPDAGALLIAELEGAAESLPARLAALEALARGEGAEEVRLARDADARAAIWRGRKSAGGAMARLAPAYHTVDVVVPLPALAEAYEEIEARCAARGQPVAQLAHAGDGNLHPLLPFDPTRAEERARVHALVEEIAQVALAAGGSVSGEHGIGLEKRALLRAMLGRAEREAMADVKRAFDPEGRLNPGKVLAPEDASAASGRRASPAVARDDVGGAKTPGFQPRDAREAARWLRARGAAGERVGIAGGALPTAASDALRWLSTAALVGVEVDAAARVLRCGAGTPLAEARAAADAEGLRLALPVPWPDATVGGALAAGGAASGLTPEALRAEVLEAWIVLGDGRRLRAGRPVAKNVAGYDLIAPQLGAGGRLGLLTRVGLRLHPPSRAEDARQTEGGTAARERAARPSADAGRGTLLRALAAAWDPAGTLWHDEAPPSG